MFKLVMLCWEICIYAHLLLSIINLLKYPKLPDGTHVAAAMGSSEGHQKIKSTKKWSMMYAYSQEYKDTNGKSEIENEWDKRHCFALNIFLLKLQNHDLNRY